MSLCAVLVSTLLSAAPLTLAQAQAEARVHASELKLAQARATGAGAVERASGRYFQDAPELSATYAPGGLVGEPGANDFELGISQRFSLFGAWSEEGKAALAARNQASANLEDAARALDEQVAVAFASVEYAQENVRYLLRTEELFAIAADAAHQALGVGSGNQLDVDAADLDLAAARADVAQAQGALATARVELSRLVGHPPDGLDVAAEPLSFDVPAPPELQALVEASPRVRAADQEVESARHALRATERSRWPALTLGVTYSRKSFEIPEGSFSGTSSALAASWKDSELGLNFSIPVPLVNTQAKPTGEAMSALLIAEAQAAVVRAEVRSEVTSSWEQLRASVTAAKALAQTPEILERDFALLGKAVRTGALDTVARAQQLRRLDEAALRWDQVRRQLAEARAHWARELAAP